MRIKSFSACLFLLRSGSWCICCLAFTDTAGWCTSTSKFVSRHICGWSWYFFILGTVLGAVIMEGFYVVFDRENRRVGFAPTSCESRDHSNIVSRVSGPYFTDGKQIIYFHGRAPTKKFRLWNGMWKFQLACEIVKLKFWEVSLSNKLTCIVVDRFRHTRKLAKKILDCWRLTDMLLGWSLAGMCGGVFRRQMWKWMKKPEVESIVLVESMLNVTADDDLYWQLVSLYMH